VILLGEITDPRPSRRIVISAVTLQNYPSVRMSRATTMTAARASNIYSRPRPTLKFFRSTPTALEPSVGRRRVAGVRSQTAARAYDALIAASRSLTRRALHVQPG